MPDCVSTSTGNPLATNGDQERRCPVLTDAATKAGVVVYAPTKSHGNVQWSNNCPLNTRIVSAVRPRIASTGASCNVPREPCGRLLPTRANLSLAWLAADRILRMIDVFAPTPPERCPRVL